ncbi:9528_t:CDS:1, partial [Dentiscutata heterogama]
QDSQGVTAAFDGWKNIIKQKLIGIVFLISKAEVLVWSIENISLSRERTEEAIAYHKKLLKKAKNQNIKII